MTNITKKLRMTVSQEHFKSTIVLFFLILMVSLFDAIGVASIFPFISLVADPESVVDVVYIQHFRKFFNITTNIQLIVGTGTILIMILISTAAIRLMTTYKQAVLVQKLEQSLSTRLLQAYLAKPYTWHLENNTGDIGKNILSEVNLIVHSFIVSVINLMSQSLLSFLILTFLFFINPIVSAALTLVGILAYLLIFLLLRRNLAYFGEKRTEANAQRYTIVNEALNAFREVELNALGSEYSARFSVAAAKLAKYQTKSQFIYLFPKHILEALVFVALIAFIITGIYRTNSIDTLLPTLALFAFAGYKLLPAANQIYVAVSMIKYCQNALQNIADTLEQHAKTDTSLKHSKNLDFQKIELINVSYSYDKSPINILRDINFKLLKSEIVALVGTSGSGKSTIIDIMMQLMEPTAGYVMLNDCKFDRDRVDGFRRIVGYVPQKVFLSDDTIANNITLSRDIKVSHMLEKALKTAELSDFVASLPNNIDSAIGEGGDRISGGQRQRIGIARALYRNPQLLVLDEATSALDPVTEKRILKNIRQNFPNLAIITVTHRYSNLTACDRIYLVSSGKIELSGDSEYLYSVSKQFRGLVNSKEEAID